MPRETKTISVGETLIDATYCHETGDCGFSVSRDSPNYDRRDHKNSFKTGEGAFKTINRVIGWLHEMDVEKVRYTTSTKDPVETKRKDKFYTRCMERAGYELVDSKGIFVEYLSLDGFTHDGPTRTFRRVR